MTTISKLNKHGDVKTEEIHAPRKLSHFHSWLIRQRLYCEKCTDRLTPATTVANINGKDYVVCDFHAGN